MGNKELYGKLIGLRLYHDKLMQEYQTWRTSQIAVPLAVLAIIVAVDKTFNSILVGAGFYWILTQFFMQKVDEINDEIKKIRKKIINYEVKLKYRT